MCIRDSFIPVLGYLDDIILLPALIALIIRLIPKETLWQFREEAKGLWENGRPKKWYFAIPIIAVWLCILWLAVGLLLNP